MTSDTFDPRDAESHNNNPRNILDRLADFVKGVGVRILVHFCALSLAVITGATLFPASFLDSAFVAPTVYIGLICLVPRGIGMTADWLLPTGFGCLHILLWIFWGVPWQYSIIWGGALTWLIRMLVKGGGIDWEWTALPWLSLSLLGFFQGLPPHLQSAPPYAAFPLLAAVGWGALRLHIRAVGDAPQKRAFQDACTRLENAMPQSTVPNELRMSLRELLRTSRRLLELRSRFDKESAPVVREFCALVRKVSASGSFASSESAELLRGTTRLTQKIKKLLAPLEPAKKDPEQDKGNSEVQNKLDAHQASLRLLVDKRYALPVEIQTHVDGIARTADAILANMRADPQDVIAGDRFLVRYIKATHTVVDEYTRLNTQTGSHGNVPELLIRSRELLARLEKAFESELAALLENDAINFTAELNVLDKLLKMDGK